MSGAAIAAVASTAMVANAQAASYNLRPGADVSDQWTAVPSGTAAAALDDALTTTGAPTSADYIYACSAGKVAEVAIGDRTLSSETPAASQAWFYANAAAGVTVKVEARSGGTTLGTYDMPAGAGFAWRSIAIQPSTQSAVNGLTLKFTAGGGCANVRAAYVQLNTTASGGTEPNPTPTPTPSATPTPTPTPTPPATGCGSWTAGYGSFGVGNWPGGCWRPYSDSSPFNKQLSSSSRVDPNSAAIVSRLTGFGSLQNMGAGSSNGSTDWAHPTFWSKPSDPLFTVHCTEAWGTCAVEGAQVRIPAGATPAAGGFNGDENYDNHMTIVDQATNTEYDFWHAQKPANGRVNIGWGGKTRIDGDGRGSDAVAAQYGTMAGQIRAEELAAGQINHALFMTVKCDSGRAVYPATKGGRACSVLGLSNTNAPNQGTRFQLNLSDAQIDALSVPAWKKTILRAMARYGMYVGDTGGTWAIQREGGTTYTSFGVTDKWVTVAKQLGIPYYAPDDSYVFNLRDGVDWARYLRVIDPCVAQGSC